MGRGRITHSPEETISFGKDIGRQLKAGQIICLRGDLAAGKTTLMKGIVEGASGKPAHEVISPTFVFLNIYPGKLTVYHFDLYRLRGCNEFTQLGFEEYFSAGGVCCIEWSERISSLLPKEALFLELSHYDPACYLSTLGGSAKCPRYDSSDAGKGSTLTKEIREVDGALQQATESGEIASRVYGETMRKIEWL